MQVSIKSASSIGLLINKNTQYGAGQVDFVEIEMLELVPDK